MATIKVKNLNYTLETKTLTLKGFNRKSHQILNNVSVTYQPGLHAIIGPSGSGKTSFIDAINGRKDSTFISYESFTVNNIPMDINQMSKYSAYVAQDDLLSGALTCLENIEFSGGVRNADVGPEGPIAACKKVIHELGLVRCQDNFIGNARMRGVSGGERKRTAIGMELITDPSILLLDEPTTGLDASTAFKVIKLLQNFAKFSQKTIILSIHQPRSSIWNLFDTITVMKKGQILFKGTTDNCVDWVTKAGYPADIFDNPADHIMDIIQKVDSSELGEIGAGAEYLDPELERVVTDKGVSTLAKTTSTLSQFKYLCSRESKCLRRDPGALKATFGSSILLAVLVIACYNNVDKFDCEPAYLNRELIPAQNRMGVTFFFCINIWMMCMSLLDWLISELAVFRRESNSNYYSAGPYFFSKICVQIIPLRFVGIFFYAFVVYWIIGFHVSFKHWLLYVIPLMLIAFCPAFMILMISPWIYNLQLAMVSFVMASLFLIFTCGFQPNIQSIPAVFRWVRHVSGMYYSYNSIIINEYNGILEKDTKYIYDNGVRTNETCDYEHSMEVVKKLIGNDDFSYRKYWTFNGIHLGIIFVYAFLAYLGLVKRSKQKY